VLVQSRIAVRDPGLSSPQRGCMVPESWGHASLRLCEPTGPAPRHAGMLETTNPAPSPLMSTGRSSSCQGLLHPLAALTQWGPSHLLSITPAASSFPTAAHLPRSLGPRWFCPPVQTRHRSALGVQQPGWLQGPVGRLLVGVRGACCNPSPALLCLLPLPAFFASSLGQRLFLNAEPCSLLGLAFCNCEQMLLPAMMPKIKKTPGYNPTQTKIPFLISVSISARAGSISRKILSKLHTLHPVASLLSQKGMEKATWDTREGGAIRANQSRLPGSLPEASSTPAPTQAAADYNEMVLASIQLQFWLPLLIL